MGEERGAVVVGFSVETFNRVAMPPPGSMGWTWRMEMYQSVLELLGNYPEILLAEGDSGGKRNGLQICHWGSHMVCHPAVFQKLVTFHAAYLISFSNPLALFIHSTH